MTTEDTLSSIDATLTGYVTQEGVDGMRWSPNKPKPQRRDTKADLLGLRRQLTEERLAGFPVREHLTYVENDTSREQEEQ